MGRVLLINDSKFESIIMRDMISSMGYNVRIADEYTAIEQVKAFRPDFVVANLTMKEIRGDQLISMIKLQYPQIKCLLSSNNFISLSDFRSGKIDAVFQTPIERNKLEQIFSSLYGLQEAASYAKTGTTMTVDRDVDKDHGISSTLTGDAKNVLVADKPQFCPYCGHSLGESLGTGFTFCPYCGHKIP